MTEIKKAKPKTLKQRAEAWAKKYWGLEGYEMNYQKTQGYCDAWLAGYRAGKREAKSNEIL